MTLNLTRSIHKGFTLIELMIVIAIIAVLATIAIPSYQNYTKKAAMTELIQAAAPYKADVELCIYNKGAATDCNAGSNGIKAAITQSGDNNKYKSIAVSKGVISVAGKGNLDGVSYTMTPTTDATNGVTWATSCSGSTDLFPAGFCS